MSEQAIQPRRDNFPTEAALEQINSLVAKLSESKALPLWCDNPGKLMMTVLAGRELGMGPMEALRSFYLVNGNFTVYGAAVVTQLKRHGYRLKWGECSDRKATVTLTAPDGETHSETYTIEEAAKAGLTTDPKKENWRKYPARMLRWKAVGQGVRFFCPEVLNGAYVREEMDGDAAPGAVAEADFTETEERNEARRDEEIGSPVDAPANGRPK